MAFRSSLFIDRLALTMDVCRGSRTRALLVAEGLEAQMLLVRSSRRDLLLHYRHAYELRFGEEQTLTIQLEPKIAYRPEERQMARGHRFVRIDWNPNKARKADPHQWGRIYELLVELVPGFNMEYLLAHAMITRVDCSFDLHGQHVSGLQIFSLLRRAHTDHFHNGPLGLVNSIGIGRYDGDKYLRVYDKRFEMQSAQIGRLARPIENRRVVRRKRPWTRFELRLKDVGSFDALNSIRNPFSGYTVRILEQMARAATGYVDGWFIDSCRLRGVHAALSTIANQRTRTRYANIVRQIDPPEWWDADQIWSEMNAAMEEVFSP